MQEISTSTGLLTINLAALADNYRLFQSKVSERCTVAGVVKADAYGLGLKPVAHKLQELGCPQYFVATLDEAIELRGYIPNTPIAVLGGFFIGAEETYIQHDIIPVLNSPDDIARWSKMAKSQNQKLPAFLHFDTGMNRLGLRGREAMSVIEHPDKLTGIDVQMVMTHFACADEPDHPLTEKQAHTFANLAQHFPNAKYSLANSPGLFRDDRFHYDMVRPGIALYGGNPTPEATNPVKPVVGLKTQVLQVRKCEAGQSIGYGASHVFDKNTTTATVALGYADGFLRSASGKAKLYWNNQPCPVIGRVSMDLVTIDLSNIENPPVQGDMMEVLGPNQSVDDLAADAETIGYEILTSLGHRYKRQYI